MATGEPTYLDAVNKRGFGVRVSFRQAGDLFGHTIWGVRPDGVDPVAESVEDGDYEGWPLSFPVQELREASGPEGTRALLLIGSAAYGHWSASVRAGVIHKTNPCIELDVAVRLHRNPAYLGAAYEIVNDGLWKDSPFDQCVAAGSWGTQRILITSSPNDGRDVHPATGGLKSFPGDNRPDRRLFLPTAPLPRSYPATYRWRYVIAAGVIR
jgi:hypothetical protein